MEENKIVLGIETSCDDTSLALIKGNGNQTLILGHQLFSQEELLKKWGGVVPEIAARNHIDKIVPLLGDILNDSGITLEEIDSIGVTTHPGLLGPLLTGLNLAKTLALYFKRPIIPVNHLYAHLEAIHLDKEIGYPYLGLLVSGGHSIFFLVRSSHDFELLGTTIDDAAGEAFDKGGRLLGLGYPSGKIIDDLAGDGDVNKYKFPIGLKDFKGPKLSFSGVKTSLRLFLEKNPHLKLEKSSGPYSEDFKDLCASYQHAIIMALDLKLKYALQIGVEKTGRKDLPIVVGGGVACNSYLRNILTDKYADNTFFVPPKFCTDNGAMVANYALRNMKNAIPFPECLEIDAKGRFLERKN